MSGFYTRFIDGTTSGNKIYKLRCGDTLQLFSRFGAAIMKQTPIMSALISVIAISCLSSQVKKNPHYTLGYPTTQVFPEPDILPGRALELPYLTPVDVEMDRLYAVGIEKLRKITYDGKVGYVLISNLTTKSGPPFVDNAIKAHQKIEFQFDQPSYLQRFKQAIQKNPYYASLVEKGLFYADDPAFLAVNGIDCGRKPQQVILIAAQSTQYPHTALILTFRRTGNPKIERQDNLSVLGGIDLVAELQELKDSRQSRYCEY